MRAFAWWIVQLGLIAPLLAVCPDGYVPPARVRVVAITTPNELNSDFASYVEFGTPRHIRKALQAVLPLVNSGRPPGVPEIELDVELVNDIKDPFELIAAVKRASLTHDIPLVAVVSPSNPDADAIVSFAAKDLQIPVFSVSPDGLFLNTPSAYPAFLRLYPGLDSVVTAFAQMFALMNVRRINIVYEDGGTYTEVAPYAARGLVTNEFEVNPLISVPLNEPSEEFYRDLWDQIAVSNDRYLAFLVSGPVFARLLYYGLKYGHLGPKEHPYVVTGPIFQLATGFRALGQQLASLGIPVRAPESIPESWKLPREANLYTIYQTLRNLLVAQVLSDNDPVAARPLEIEFARVHNATATTTNDYTVYTPRIADAMWMIRSGLETAVNGNKLCNFVNSSAAVGVDFAYEMGVYRKAVVAGSSGLLRFSNNGEVLSSIRFHQLLWGDTGEMYAITPTFTYDSARNVFINGFGVDTGPETVARFLTQDFVWNYLTPQFRIPLDREPIPASRARQNLIHKIVPAVVVPSIVGILILPFVVHFVRNRTLRFSVEISPRHIEVQERGYLPISLGHLRLGTYKGEPIIIQEIDVGPLIQAAKKGHNTVSPLGKVVVDGDNLAAGAFQHLVRGSNTGGTAAQYGGVNTAASVGAFQDKGLAGFIAQKHQGGLSWHHALALKLTNLRHRNLCTTIGVIGGKEKLIFSFVHERLMDSLKKNIGAFRDVKVKRRLLLVKDVVDGLVYLSRNMPYGASRPLLRSGIRLGNIFLDAIGTAKIAVSIEDDSGPSSCFPEILQLYVAPEILESGIATEAGDVFFIGSLAFMILNGIETELGLLRAVQKAETTSAHRSPAVPGRSPQPTEGGRAPSTRFSQTHPSQMQSQGPGGNFWPPRASSRLQNSVMNFQSGLVNREGSVKVQRPGIVKEGSEYAKASRNPSGIIPSNLPSRQTSALLSTTVQPREGATSLRLASERPPSPPGSPSPAQSEMHGPHPSSAMTATGVVINERESVAPMDPLDELHAVSLQTPHRPTQGAHTGTPGGKHASFDENNTILVLNGAAKDLKAVKLPWKHVAKSMPPMPSSILSILKKCSSLRAQDRPTLQELHSALDARWNLQSGSD